MMALHLFEWIPAVTISSCNMKIGSHERSDRIRVQNLSAVNDQGLHTSQRPGSDTMIPSGYASSRV